MARAAPEPRRTLDTARAERTVRLFTDFISFSSHYESWISHSLAGERRIGASRYTGPHRKQRTRHRLAFECFRGFAEPRTRDEEGGQIAAAEGTARRLLHGNFDDPVQSSIGCIALDPIPLPDRVPDEALAIDAGSVRHA